MTRNKWADRCAERWLCGAAWEKEPRPDLERAPRRGGVRSTRTRKQRCTKRLMSSSNADLREWRLIPPLVESSPDKILEVFKILFLSFCKCNFASWHISTRMLSTVGLFLSQRRVRRPTLFRWTLSVDRFSYDIKCHCATSYGPNTLGFFRNSFKTNRLACNICSNLWLLWINSSYHYLGNGSNNCLNAYPYVV